ncbi:uncharacterized protein LOC135348161 [Halichondria panicea]|uniref:uncharacterized protein LOC135348161 n=1 Tax=Halichondria panicea TaxID=6063 RepID=UPI00312B747A
MNRYCSIYGTLYIPSLKTLRGFIKPVYKRVACYLTNQQLLQYHIMSVYQRGSQLQKTTAPSDTGVRQFTSEELSRHCLRHNAHVAYRGKVRIYDVSSFVAQHPGGMDQILMGVGRDITQVFDSYHQHDTAAKVLDKYYVGELVDNKLPVFPKEGKFYSIVKKRVEDYMKAHKLDPKINYWTFLRHTILFVSVFSSWFYQDEPSQCLPVDHLLCWQGCTCCYEIHHSLLLHDIRKIGCYEHSLYDVVYGYWLAQLTQVNHVTEEVEWPEPDTNNVIHQEWAEMQVRTARDYCTDSWLWYFLSGGLNHQTAHHLFPGVLQSNYWWITPIVKETCAEFGIQYNGSSSFKDALSRHFSYLRKMGKEGPEME